MALQSTFYKDVTKYESPVAVGLTKRQLLTVVSMIPGAILIIFEVIFLRGLLFNIVAVLTGLLFIGIPVFRYIGKFKAIQRDIEFFLVEQERVYEVGQIRRYEAHEFIQKKTISEAEQV